MKQNSLKPLPDLLDVTQVTSLLEQQSTWSPCSTWEPFPFRPRSVVPFRTVPTVPRIRNLGAEP